MQNMRIWLWLFFAGVYAALPPVTVAQEDDDEVVEEVVVMGMRATQGGAQDINFFRGEVEQARIPHPGAFTAEGLFSEHNILFAEKKPCDQLFCLVEEAISADLIVQPEAKILVGLGFTSNMAADKWRRLPLNLVAVVDKSGSMEGEPLELVRKSLRKIVKQLKEDDQITIVLYGDQSHIYLEPVKTSGRNKDKILRAIDKIESSGSTYLESGLKLGYETAFGTMEKFKGSTRLMLFTDERPNVGRTDADSFMSIATAGSNKGVGLTTIGVGEQFGAELATKISSVRGGNLFFIQNERDVNNLYGRELDYMVSELAHDLRMTITASPDYSVSGIYGVPGELLGWQKDKTVTLTIPTIFLSSRGGAMFISLARNIEDAHLPRKPLGPDAALAKIDMEYIPATPSAKTEQYSLTVKSPGGEPSTGMKLGHILVNEFTALHRAVSEHYLKNDQEQAYRITHALSTRLKQSGAAGLEEEKKLVYSLEQRFAFLSGHGSEADKKNNFARLWGVWKINRIKGNLDWVKKGDKLVFSPDNELKIYQDHDGEYRTDNEGYQANNEQIYVEGWEMAFRYVVDRDRLILEHRRPLINLYLIKSSLGEESEPEAGK